MELLRDVFRALPDVVSAFQEVGLTLFARSLRSLIDSLGLDFTLPDWAWLNWSPFQFMFTVGLGTFVIVTLIKWIIDVLP